MEQLAEARIAAWQGGSLWLLRTRLPGAPGAEDGPRTGFHAHHAVQVVISLGGAFRLWLADAGRPDNELGGPYAAVAPDAPHRFDARGAYAILFVEPESRAGRALVAATFADGDLQPLPPARFEALRPTLAALAETPPPEADALADLGRGLTEGLAGAAPAGPLDPRIQAVIAWVAGRPDQPAALADAARVAGLSESRLSHLFVEQTGLSFKTYLLWIRLTHAVGLMTQGLSLTAVAHEAGFADSAHFSRTFRRMFGVAPASLRLV